MEELIIESITPEDFLLIKKILETYKVGIMSDVSFNELHSIYEKITDIVACFEDK
jgi:hypothetical protein